MRNFCFWSGNEAFRECCYVISRNNPSFSYFKSEFESFPSNNDGSLLVPSSVVKPEKKGRVKLFVGNIRRRIFEGGESILVPVSSDAYTYFSGEYRNGYVEDINHNIIIPRSEYRKVKKPDYKKKKTD